MGRTEKVELTVLCLLRDHDKFLLQVMLSEDLSEFQYIPEDGGWKAIIK